MAGEGLNGQTLEVAFCGRVSAIGRFAASRIVTVAAEPEASIAS
jgi:hypothetical protein